VAFFDADRHQTIDFVSKSIQRIDDHTVRVSGDLTLLGLRKPLSVAVTRGTEGLGNASTSWRKPESTGSLLA
jgi:polyisoprenoid-binding protein YceI